MYVYVFRHSQVCRCFSFSSVLIKFKLQELLCLKGFPLILLLCVYIDADLNLNSSIFFTMKVYIMNKLKVFRMEKRVVKKVQRICKNIHIEHSSSFFTSRIQFCCIKYAMLNLSIKINQAKKNYQLEPKFN